MFEFVIMFVIELLLLCGIIPLAIVYAVKKNNIVRDFLMILLGFQTVMLLLFAFVFGISVVTWFELLLFAAIITLLVLFIVKRDRVVKDLLMICIGIQVCIIVFVGIFFILHNISFTYDEVIDDEGYTYYDEDESWYYEDESWYYEDESWYYEDESWYYEDESWYYEDASWYYEDEPDYGYDDNSDYGYDDITPQTTGKPYTYMDLFDGGKKIWYHISEYYQPRTVSEVEAVMVTENGKVIELYYCFRGANYNGDVSLNMHPDPFSSRRFTLADFSGKTDSEILSMVRENYANAKYAYPCTYDGGSFTFPAQSLPHTISYSVRTDASGNNAVHETLNLWQTDFNCSGELGWWYTGHLQSDFAIIHTMMPCAVLEKEYVGMSNTMDSWVTVNRYNDFGALNYDSVSGADSIYR